MRLPIGLQDFQTLREEGFVYVDKTMFMQPFVAGGGRFFFARPRRFGKSLLLSTLKAAFTGRKDLFKNLWLEQHHDFKKRPVIRIDFSQLDFRAQSLEIALIDHFQSIAKNYDLTLTTSTAKRAFELLIEALSSHAKIVVLIDEYDKAITDYLYEPEKRIEHQKVLRSVYGVLKSMDQYLHLVFLTGVSKIGKLNLFSDLNNLQDISLNPKFATLCGYSKTEIEQSFPDYLKNAANLQQTTLEALWDGLKYWYNGYSWNAVDRLYCPFSFLLFLSNPQFRSFWYETGTPTFLVEAIRKAQLNPLEFELTQLPEQAISSTNLDQIDSLSLMFQTGYLTIIGVQSNVLGTRYDLSYPNQEVRLAFSRNLLEEYSQSVPSKIGGFALKLQDALLVLDWEKFFSVCNEVLAGIPYEVFPRKEMYANSILHVILTSTGFKTQSQVQTSLGRIDILVETFTHSLIFEIKIGGSVKEALQQINQKHYADMLSKPVLKVGVVFDLETKSITEWEVEKGIT